LKPLAIALWLAVALSAVAIPRYTLDAVLAIGQGAGVPREITYALMMEESGGDAAARSKLTCEGYRSRGLFQLYERPSNLATLIARYWLGPFDILNPLQNATVALRYLADLYGRFGTWELALWFYNSGRIVNVPASTRAYARRIVDAVRAP
jgi:soluble lytic murein transglycosylase-like protein